MICGVGVELANQDQGERLPVSKLPLRVEESTKGAAACAPAAHPKQETTTAAHTKRRLRSNLVIVIPPKDVPCPAVYEMSQDPLSVPVRLILPCRLPRVLGHFRG